MSRLPRIVVPDAPHHVTQRGNRRERIFFRNEDYALSRSLMAEACELNRTEVRVLLDAESCSLDSGAGDSLGPGQGCR